MSVKAEIVTRDARSARIQAITSAVTKLGADKGKLELDSIGNPASRILRSLRFVDTRAAALGNWREG